MPEPLLSARLFAVFTRVPAAWWPEDEVKASIAIATGQDVRTVTHRLAWLRRIELVERRGSCVLGSKYEIRKVAL